MLAGAQAPDLGRDARPRPREAAGARSAVYGVVVDSVNVSVLLYVPARSTSVAPIA